ncbi:hypothetical protein LCGC14_0569830 [marine sediment metagenome]|uniref:Uncharacterized protein n=1 Tax=marine sediment metagenome TaxID=412755 RepID=A0A0F9U5T5_9ZZZZ
MKCKNCGHTIKLNENKIIKREWYHILSKAHGGYHHNFQWGSCKCNNPEPEVQTHKRVR